MRRPLGLSPTRTRTPPLALPPPMDPSPCPLDREYADQIAGLLSPPSPESAQEYYDDIIKRKHRHRILIKQSEFGKGLYANVDFKQDELIFKDQMLVASQHTSNKIDCLVCSYCFCFIGSVEFQIGRKLYLQGLGLSAKGGCHSDTMSDDSEEDCPFETADQGFIRNGDCVETCASSSANSKPIPEEILASLMNNTLALPYSENFSLPPVVLCPGGCEEEHYCSKACAEADWEAFHSLLCSKGSDSSRREAIAKFIRHASRTNDIFILAAKMISSTILAYRKLKDARFGREASMNNRTNMSSFSLLLEAWKPVSMGFKKRWWDCVALPNDIDSNNEVSFRLQIRDLAYTSLQLLRGAIFDEECAPLFSLNIYGHIIGMFELNNLDLVVASPVEDYFIYIDDLPTAEKNEAEKVTRPFLDALGDEYSVSCQGTAFFPLQSCMNHSCQPNAKAFKREEDKDGQATLVALRPIIKGEEITISYIDEDLPYEERVSLLADYGFKCRCPKCLEETS